MLCSTISRNSSPWEKLKILTHSDIEHGTAACDAMTLSMRRQNSKIRGIINADNMLQTIEVRRLG